MQRGESWGRYPRGAQESGPLWWRDDPLPEAATLLPYGNGLSYGDSCLNPGGCVITTRTLDRFIAFDETRGVLRCEAGVTLGEILDRCVPRGWFLPVVPGTQFVTVGGAIANDVHGKNHHVAGTFGCHVNSFELRRSDGERLLCTAEDNGAWFRATIGGLGLTGVITWAELQLKRIHSALVECESLPFASLAQFSALCAASDRDFEYTVAWFDCYSWQNGALRGVFTRGRHVEEDDGTLAAPRPRPRASVPFPLPGWVLGRWSMRAFNALYYAIKSRQGRQRVRFEPFLFPLDVLTQWNLAYGPRGFMQLQCVVPVDAAERCLAALLQRITESGQGSFLAVMKCFGDRVSPGCLSFPMPGTTLALDFQNRGESTLSMLRACHELIAAHGGRIYPAKDACMSPEVFATGFPHWRELLPNIDPAFTSGFWRRTAGALNA